MKRRVLNLAAFLSLLLCAAVGGLWAYGGLEVLNLRYSRSPAPEHTYALYFRASSSSGTLNVSVSHRDFPPSYLRRLTAGEKSDFTRMYPSGLKMDLAWGWQTIFYNPEPTGFRVQHGVYPQPAGWRSEYWLVGFPHWMVMGMLLIAPAFWLHQRGQTQRARCRIRRGLCRNCGYDLRATPEQDGARLDRCPECGTYPQVLSSPHERNGSANQHGD